jgi:ComF family protein
MFIPGAISKLYDAALALAYPRACAVCEGSVESRGDGVACAGCWQETRLLTDQDTLCRKCGALSFHFMGAHSREEVLCHRCDDRSFDSARACGIYEGALRASVIELKRAANLPRRLSALFCEACLRPPLNRATVIVPVPLHTQRERERGFNQAEVLARELARRINLPLVDNCLLRVVQTERHRAGMDARARRESVTGAFALISPRRIAGESVLLIDDVLTTGATLSACAEVLRDGGAKEVLALTLARPFG